MTAATIRASAAYRKRQAAKMKRYESALHRISLGQLPHNSDDRPAVIARAALQEPSDA